MQVPFGGDESEKYLANLLGNPTINSPFMEIKGGQGSSSTSKAIRAYLDSNKGDDKKSGKNEKQDKDK